MARTFHVEIDSSAEVDHVLAAFGDEAYWGARLMTFSNGTATLDALDVDDGNVVTVAITLRLLGDRLPKFITTLRSDDLVIKRTERWQVATGGAVRGNLMARMPGAPFAMAGEALIAPADQGSRLDYTATVDVRLPLVGSRIEGYIAGQAGTEISAIHRFTGEWIAENH